MTSDPALRSLDLALDAERMLPLVAQALGLSAAARRGLRCVPEVLSHKPGRRCTIRYTLAPATRGHTRDPLRRVIGKLYGSRRRAARCYERMAALRSRGSGGGVPCIPACLMHVRSLALFFQECVDGAELDRVIADAPTQAPLVLAAEWLTRLHASPPLAGLREISSDRALGKVDLWCREIADGLAPGDAAGVQRALSDLTDLAAALPPIPPTMIHRDYYHAQVLWNGDRIWVLDFDELGLGDPAFDVGHFLAHLEYKAYLTSGRPDTYGELASVFENAYARRSSFELRPRLAFHRAYTFLKLAHTEVVRRRSGWPHRARVLLEYARRELWGLPSQDRAAPRPGARRFGKPSTMQRIAVVNYRALSPTESFIRDQVNRLPFEVALIHRESPELCEIPPPLAPFPAVRRSERLVERYVELLCDQKVELVLAQFGTTAVEVLPACRALELPLVVHFHGHDVSRRDLLERYEKDYREVFAYAQAMVCVSRAMRSKLLEIGASDDRLHLIPYGVDTSVFAPAEDARVPGRLVYCGRFVQKKAPHLVLTAFREIHRRFPDSRLHMIGSGPLYEVCRDLVEVFGLRDRVRFLGLLDSARIREELRRASVFLNHSVTALDGNSEGTPVTLLEASAAGLPVVASRHAGIPDAVLHEQTGLLVEERDVAGLAENVCRILADPELGRQLGRRGRAWIEREFEAGRQIAKLSEVLRAAGPAACRG